MAATTLLEPGVPRAESLARRISQQIKDNGLAPGARLGTRAELREQYGIAPATLNEAIRLLTSTGMVQARPGPGGGVFVAAPTPQVRLKNLFLDAEDGAFNAADCIAVQNALEPLVCQEAAANRKRRDVKELYVLVDAIERNGDDPLAFLHAIWALHRRIGLLVGNEVLRTVYTTVLDGLESTVHHATADRAFNPKRGALLHRRLVEAIDSGDQERVRAAVAAHGHTDTPLR